MNINYRKDLARQLQEVAALPEKPRLLLHACCGPCAAPVLEKLRDFFRITILYYNPNTGPEAEYLRRLEALKKVRAAIAPESELLVPDYRPEEFHALARGLEALPEGDARCRACWQLRLENTARLAKEGGYDWFGSVLTLGTTKPGRVLNPMGEALSKTYGVRWLIADFKKDGGYDRSLELCEALGIYRQDYCGCVYSIPKERAKA